MHSEREKVITQVLSLDRTPNVPYYPQASETQIRELLSAYPNLEVVEDELAIYARYTHGKPTNRLVIDTHLDHPGLAYRPDKLITLGSLFPAEAAKAKKSMIMPVRLYQANGEYLTSSQVEYAPGGDPKLVDQDVLKKNALPRNSQVVPWISGEPREDLLRLRSADNLAVTAVGLVFLDWLFAQQPEADVTFIFTKLEEIRQISATGIAKKNGTPFGQFDEHTHIIMLEAAAVGQTALSRTVADTETNYDDGVVIRIADAALPYQVNGQTNFAEALALHSRDRVGGAMQHGPLISNCDATSYTLFSQCPNIVSLTVPCRNKHNFTEDGEFTPEIVTQTDLLTMLALLQSMTQLASQPIQAHPEQILVSGAQFPGLRNLHDQRTSWQGAYEWGHPRLARKHLLSENIGEQATFFWGVLQSVMTQKFG